MTPKSKRPLVIGALLTIVALGVGAILYTQYQLKLSRENARREALARVEKAQGQSITLTETQNGHKKWVLKVKQIQYSKDNNIANMQGVLGLVYGDDQDILFGFDAPAGVYDRNKKSIALTSGASLVSPKANLTMTAPQISWSDVTHQISANGGVEMKKKGFGITRASSANVSMDFSHIEFHGSARTAISL